MKLCTFAVATPLGQITRVGVKTDRGIVDATAARTAFLAQSMPIAAAQRVAAAQLPPDMLQVIGTGQAAMQWLAEAVEYVLGGSDESGRDGETLVYGDSDVKLLAPVPRPPGIANFSVWPAHTAAAAAHGFESLKAAEAGSGVMPYWKGNPDSMVGPDSVPSLPDYAEELDIECELVCIVGTGGRDLSREDAARAIAGYTIVNDASARDTQRIEMRTGRGPSKGKDFDGGNVMGPWIVTPDEIGDIKTLRLSLHINGEELSSSDASGMIWDFPEMLSYLSKSQTVHPGQVISAGCYAGGSAMDLNRKLNPGDVVELRISRIGSLVSRIGGRSAS